MACEGSGSEVSEMVWECNRVSTWTPLSIESYSLSRDSFWRCSCQTRHEKIAMVVDKTVAAASVSRKLCDR